jgi:menaquinol-cytochrome c reductase iron-sulfur subunit
MPPGGPRGTLRPFMPNTGPAGSAKGRPTDRGAGALEHSSAADARRDSSGEQPPSPERRRMLTALALGLGGAGAVVAGAPIAVFLVAPIGSDGEAWRAVARAADLAVGQTIKVTFLDPAPVPWAGFAARSAAWLRRESEAEFVAFSLYCTHTGCPVRWEEGAQLFLCPCHGGAFYRNGDVAAGPPPVPLLRHPVRVRNGTVEVRTIGLRVPGD